MTGNVVFLARTCVAPSASFGIHDHSACFFVAVVACHIFGASLYRVFARRWPTHGASATGIFLCLATLVLDLLWNHLLLDSINAYWVVLPFALVFGAQEAICKDGFVRCPQRQ